MFNAPKYEVGKEFKKCTTNSISSKLYNATRNYYVPSVGFKGVTADRKQDLDNTNPYNCTDVQEAKDLR